MRKIKEFLLFTALLIMPIVLFFIISPFSANMLSSSPSFVSVCGYIRMFLNDKTFVRALLNILLPPAIVSFLLVSVFANIVFLVRKKIKVSRWVFYLGSVVIGGITTLFYTSYLSIAFSHMASSLFAAQTILQRIIVYKPSVFDAINLPNVLYSLYIGILTAFVFWVLELIADIIKVPEEKGNAMNKFNLAWKLISSALVILYGVVSLFWCYVPIKSEILSFSDIRIGVNGIVNSIEIIGGPMLFILLSFVTVFLLAVLTFKKQINIKLNILLSIFIAISLLIFMMIPFQNYYIFYLLVKKFSFLKYTRIFYIILSLIIIVKNILFAIKRRNSKKQKMLALY